MEKSGAWFSSPHDLEDVIARVREVGGLLVGRERADRFEATFSRPLAHVGGSSRGMPQPRVVAVVGLDPLLTAGGHSFETDRVDPSSRRDPYRARGYSRREITAG